MHKGVILIEQAGKRIDPDILATAAKLYPTGWGVSVVTEDDGVKSMLAQGAVQAGGNTTESLTKLLEDFEDDFCILYVFKQDGETEALQPFLLFGDEETPHMVVYISGELKKYHKKDGNIPAKEFVDFFLQPACEKIFEEMEGETIDELFEELNTNSDFQNQVLDQAGPEAVLLFHASNGKEFTILAKDAKDRSFSWGILSNGEGFDAPTMGKKPKKQIKVSLGTDTELIPKKPAVPAEPPKLVAVQIDPKMSNNDRRNFIHKRLGTLPENWKELAAIMVPYDVAKKLGDMTFKDFKEASKSIETAPAKAAADKPASQPVVPLITAEDKKKGQAFRDLIKIPDDPATYKDAEEKLGSWVEQTGKKVQLEETFRWPFKTLLEYCENVPGEAAVLMFQYRRMLMENYTTSEEKEKAPAKPKKVIKAA